MRNLAGAAAVLTVVGWSATGTWASWEGVQPLDVGQVRSGHLALRLSGDGVVQVPPSGGLTSVSPVGLDDAVPAQTASYELTRLQASALRPGHHVQARVTVGNAGSVGLRYGISRVAASNPTLGAALRLTVWPVGPAGSCPAGPDVATPTPAPTPLFAGTLDGAATPVDRALAPGAATDLCLRVGLPTATTDRRTEGTSTSAVLTFSAEQA